MNKTTSNQDRAGQIWIALGAVLIFWVAFFTQLTGWFMIEAQAAQTGQTSSWPGIGYALLVVAVIGLYSRVFGYRPQRIARYRAVLDSWGLSTLFVLLMLPLRFFAPLGSADLTPWMHFIQLIALLLFIGILRLTAERRNLAWRPAANAGWLPWAITPILMAGWFEWGAFGSVLETIVGILLGLLFGYAVGILVGQFLLPAIQADSQGSGWDMWLTGWAVGGILVIMGSAFGAEGQLIYLGLLLPFVGWLGTGLIQVGNSAESPHASFGRLIGLVTAIVLISADVDELSILFSLDTTESFVQLFSALGLSILAATILSILFWLCRSLLARWQPSYIVRFFTIAVWIGAGFLLVQKVNRGFHGDQLFVIMKQQADLSTAPDIESVAARREFVYEQLIMQADQSQQAMRAALDLMGAEYQPYYLVNGIAVRGGLPMRLFLSTFSGVDRIIADPILRPLPNMVSPPVDDSMPPPNALPWGIKAIEADRVWNELGVRGAGVVIGQSDSGVQWDHPEFADSYRGADGSHDYNWLDPWNAEAQPYDIGGHGTHTLGTVLGNRVGVAPDATWFSCANLVRNIGSASLYLDCMQFMLAPYPLGGDALVDGKTEFSADVLNNSWGCPPFEGCDPTALQTGVEALRAAGIFVVVSAGNDGEGGCGTVSSPLALYDASFSVGAFKESGEIAPFSSRGPVSADGSRRTKPDIIAPGVDVISAWPGNSYQPNQGTSMAGPHVAGVVALIWSANPNLRGNINATELILTETATAYDTAKHGVPTCGDAAASPNNAVGYGVVNAYNAVEMALDWR